MRPDSSRTLQAVGMSLVMNIMPELRTPFGQNLASHAAGLAIMIAEESERAADRLVTENRVVRELLTDGLALAGEARAAVEAALATSAAPNLRVSSLQAENDVLRRGLIELHAAVESNQTPEAAAMNERIWAELIESTRRRQFQVRM
jgi:hypothetical protein